MLVILAAVHFGAQIPKSTERSGSQSVLKQDTLPGRYRKVTWLALGQSVETMRANFGYFSAVRNDSGRLIVS
jgi:hypothetical protein